MTLMRHGRCCKYSLFTLLALLANLAFSSPSALATDLLPLSSSEQHEPEMILLTVDKSSLQADLRTLPPLAEDSQILQSFRIAIGKEAGDKEREGDNRTPEGIYFSLKHIITKDILPAKYGPRSIPLNFPNLMDKRDGKTGYGIWLHGAGNDNRIASAQVTEGCVAFYNADIVKLKSWLQPDQGIVVIAEDVAQVNQAEDVRQVHASTLAWVEAWQQRNLPNYMQHYDVDFVSGSRNTSAYHKYKNRVFNSYTNMSVEISNLRVITHPKYALAIMNQDFKGDERFESIGRKMLYWLKRPEGWRIVREYYDNKRFRPLNYTMNDLADLRTVVGSKTAVLH